LEVGMANIKDLKGQVFGRLHVIAQGRSINSLVSWICKCDCGKIVKIRSGSLVAGYTKSCGCLNSEIASKKSKKHGKYYHPLYRVYAGMKQRCYYKKHEAFKRYGGRGIKICDEWLNDFMSFFNFAMANG